MKSFYLIISNMVGLLIETNSQELINTISNGLSAFICDVNSHSINVSGHLEIRYTGQMWIICDNGKHYSHHKCIIDVLVYLQECIDELVENFNTAKIFIQLHGGSIYNNHTKKAIGVIGPTHSGKSSLIVGSVLSEKFSYISDDSIIFDYYTKQLSIFPQIVFLRNILLFGSCANKHCFAQGYSEIKKEYIYALSFSVPDNAPQISNIVILERNEMPDFNIETMNYAKKYECLLLNSKFPDHIPSYRTFLLNISRNIPIYRLNYESIANGVNGLESLL